MIPFNLGLFLGISRKHEFIVYLITNLCHWCGRWVISRGVCCECEVLLVCVGVMITMCGSPLSECVFKELVSARDFILRVFFRQTVASNALVEYLLCNIYKVINYLVHRFLQVTIHLDVLWDWATAKTFMYKFWIKRTIFK